MTWCSQPTSAGRYSRVIGSCPSTSPPSGRGRFRCRHAELSRRCGSSVEMGWYPGIPVEWRSPLSESGCGHRRPAGFDGVVEQVAVGEVLDHQLVGIVPVVEDLTA